MVHDTFTDLKLYLLKSMRGKHSQQAISKRLGYGFNQVYRWESGRIGMSWKDFALYCDVCKVDLKLALGHLLGEITNPQDHCQIFSRIIGRTPIANICKQTGISRQQLDRWRKRRASPSVEQIFHFLNESMGVTLDLAKILNRNKKIPTSITKLIDDTLLKNIAVESPISLLVGILFAMDEYQNLKKHKDGYIASKLGISIVDEHEMLSNLIKAGELAKKNGKFISQAPRIRTKTPSFTDHKTIIKFWLQRAMNTLDAQKDFNDQVSIMGYRVMGISNECYQRIVERYRQFQNEIGLMIREDQDAIDVACVMSLQLFDPIFMCRKN